jgi:hypothetical protein
MVSFTPRREPRYLLNRRRLSTVRTARGPYPGRGKRGFSISETSQTVCGARRASFSIGYRCCLPGVKRSGCDVDRSTPADVKEWSYTSTPLIRLHGMDRGFIQKAYNKMISTAGTIHIISDVRKFHLKSL